MKKTNLRCLRVPILCGPLLLLLLALVGLSCGHAAREQDASLHSVNNGGTATNPVSANQKTVSSNAPDGGGYNLQAPISPDQRLCTKER